MRHGSPIAMQGYGTQEFYRKAMRCAREYLKVLEAQLEAATSVEECVDLRGKIIHTRTTIAMGERIA